jgi:hypothetical protein
MTEVSPEAGSAAALGRLLGGQVCARANRLPFTMDHGRA